MIMNLYWENKLYGLNTGFIFPATCRSHGHVYMEQKGAVKRHMHYYVGVLYPLDTVSVSVLPGPYIYRNELQTLCGF